jgi:hypothetical protein
LPFVSALIIPVFSSFFPMRHASILPSPWKTRFRPWRRSSLRAVIHSQPQRHFTN